MAMLVLGRVFFNKTIKTPRSFSPFFWTFLPINGINNLSESITPKSFPKGNVKNPGMTFHFTHCLLGIFIVTLIIIS